MLHNTHRRYYLRAEGDPIKPLLYRLAAVVVLSVGASISYTLQAHVAAPLTFLGGSPSNVVFEVILCHVAFTATLV